MNFWQSTIFLGLLALTSGQVVDQTRVPGAKGSAVVEGVLDLIRESCIFTNDRLYLRRLAFVESNDGLSNVTYRPGFYGGIWQITRDMYDQTKTASAISAARERLKNSLSIDWSRTTWEDLRKPLYSGVAAALYTLLKAGANGVPAGVEQQATFWTANTPHATSESHDYFSKVNTLSSSCSSSVQLDLLFILDSSTSLSSDQFDTSKDFVKNVVDKFDVSRDKVRVAVIEYSTAVDVSFDLDDYGSKDEVKKALDAIRYTSGGTNTGLALQYAVDNVFTQARGMRKGSVKVLVLITDGKSDNTRDTLQKAAIVKSKGITVFTIGVTSLVDKNELDSVASSPACSHSQILADFTDLDGLKNEIQRVTCKAPAVLPQGTNYTFPCGSDVTVKILPNVTAGSTITVTPIEGSVTIYGSVVSSNPSSVQYEFSKVADARLPVTFYVRGNRSISLALVSSIPNSCKTTFLVDVEDGNNIKKYSNLLCIQADLSITNCSAQTLQSSPFMIVPPPYNNINPRCPAGQLSLLPYPYANDRFIYCDGNGNFFVVLCPVNQIFDITIQFCVPGTYHSYTMSPPPTTMTPPRTTTQPIIVVPRTTPTSIGSNPCTPEALIAGHFYFPYPEDKRAYYECYNFPYVAVVKFCDQYHYWDQKTLTCLYEDLVVDPTKDAYIKDNNPCKSIPDLYFYPYPGSDVKYIHCDDFGDAFIKVCPDNKRWNQALLQCIPRGILYTLPPNPIGKK